MEEEVSKNVVASETEKDLSNVVSNVRNYGKDKKSKYSSTAASEASSPSQPQSASKTKPASTFQPKRSSGRGGSSGGGYKSNWTKHAEHGRAVAGPELGSVARPGSRKGGPVREYADFYDRRRDGGYENRGRSGGRFDARAEAAFYQRSHNTQRNRNLSLCYGPSYNKEQYLQATCQFIVSEGFNYNAHITDADLIVDWDRIEELRLAVDEIPCCPICLYQPNAAKITRCGHVFCWPCILHYLALSDKTWRKCPICYESVYKNQLKSVVAMKVADLNVGGEMGMLLMRREKGSNIVSSANETTQHKKIQQIGGSNTQFAKILSISREQVIVDIVERERAELVVKLTEEGDEPEACFVRDALESLQEREDLLKMEKPVHEKSPSSGSPPTSNFFPPHSLHATEVYIDAFNDEKRSGGSCSVRSAQSAPAAVTSSTRFSSSLNNGSIDDGGEETEGGTGCVDAMAAAATAVSTMNDKFYYFYQAQDGQQVYLHPVSARCFIHQYGSLASAPPAISGIVTEIETFVMTEDLRRRYRYLSHLPLTSTFKLAELKFDTNFVSSETMKTFAGDFAKREDVRQRKAKEEKRQQTHAERWERLVMMDPRNYAKYSSSKGAPPEIPFTTLVPSAQRDIEASFANSVVNDSSPVQAAASDTTQTSASPGETIPSTLSFAQMLRQGKPKPAQNSAPQLASQPDHPGTAGNVRNGDIDDLDEDQREFLNLHSYQDSFGDALQLALDKYQNSANVHVDQGDQEETMLPASGKKKKKKTKGRLLFSMGAAAPGLH